MVRLFIFKLKKGFATSDAIRNKLQDVGVQLKDEKDESVSYSLLL